MVGVESSSLEGGVGKIIKSHPSITTSQVALQSLHVNTIHHTTRSVTSKKQSMSGGARRIKNEDFVKQQESLTEFIARQRKSVHRKENHQKNDGTVVSSQKGYERVALPNHKRLSNTTSTSTTTKNKNIDHDDTKEEVSSDQYEKESFREFVRRQRQIMKKNRSDRKIKNSTPTTQHHNDKIQNKSVSFQIDTGFKPKKNETIREFLDRKRIDSPTISVTSVDSGIKSTNLKSKARRVETPSPNGQQKLIHTISSTSSTKQVRFLRKKKQVSPMDHGMSTSSMSYDYHQASFKSQTQQEEQSTGRTTPPIDRLYLTPQQQQLAASSNNTTVGSADSKRVFVNLTDDFHAENPPSVSPKPSVSPSFIVPTETLSNKQSGSTLDIPLVTLGKFQESIYIDFGDHKNLVGETRSLPFMIYAPFSEDNPAAYHSIDFERIPFKNGFNLHKMEHGMKINVFDEDSTEKSTLFVRSGETKQLLVSWTPKEAGGVRETIHLKLGRGRIRIVAHGSARLLKGKIVAKSMMMQENKTKQSTKQTMKMKQNRPLMVSATINDKDDSSTLIDSNERKRVVMNKKIKTRSQTAATNSSAKPSLSKKPEKVAVKRIVDDSWAEKQSEAFCKWLNFNFDSSEDLEFEIASIKAQGGERSRTALRTLQFHQRKAQAKIKAVSLYNSPEFVGMRHAIESEIKRKRLLIRSDKDVFADVGLKGQMVKMLLSYSSAWLRLGLETIFGETITLDQFIKEQEERSKIRSHLGILTPDKNDAKPPTYKSALKKFILDRVISDPHTKKKYTGGKCNLPSGRFEKQFKQEIRQNALRRILLLVVFLDHAKINNILPKGPCLFTRNGMAKSSRDILVILCRDYMGGEGDIVKHLIHIGVSITYEQKFIDEFDFSVSNLAIDLRDGVRLGKLTEILTGDAELSLLGKMRLPAVSRLQKLFNMRIVLTAFAEMDLENIEDVSENHIVDGHRAQVLKLLWSIVSHFRLPLLLKPQQIMNEIDAVYRSHKLRATIEKSRYTNGEHDWRKGCSAESHDIPSLLLQWCKAVCSSYGKSIDNFTTSFSDGKALCFLIHFYQPGILSLDEIFPTCEDIAENANRTKHHNLFFSSKNNHSTSCSSVSEALDNERKNSQLAMRRMTDIGGIPNMLPITDSRIVPEEKSMIISIAYLCSRLIESSREILASIAIQSCYRKYQNRKLLIKKKEAASVIISYWRRFKDNYYERRNRKYKESVLIIESFYITVKERLKQVQREREIVIRDNAVLTIQAFIRCKIVQKQFAIIMRKNKAATKIQSQFRSFFDRSTYLKRIASIIQMQRIIRGLVARNRYNQMIESVILIQKVWRGHTDKCRFYFTKLEVILIQSKVRQYFARKAMAETKHYILRLQCIMRCWIARRKLQMLKVERNSAIIIQSQVRKKQAVDRYCNHKNMVKAATVIQQYFRCHYEETVYRIKKYSIVQLQAFWRGIFHRNKYDSIVSSLIRIQALWRGYICGINYELTRMDIILVQSLVRRHIAMKEISKRRISIILIQSQVRKYQAKVCFRQILNENQAAITIQKHFRRLSVSTSYAVTLYSLTQIQAFWRGFAARKNLTLQISAATKIQAIWRAYMCVCDLDDVKSQIIAVQCVARKWLAEKQSLQRYYALNVIQRAIRKHLSIKKLNTLRLERNRLIEEIRSATLIQAQVRKSQAVLHFRERRQMKLGAIKIQQYFRRYSQVLKFNSMKDDIVRLQAHIRGFLQRQKQHSYNQAAVSIQTIWRGYSNYTKYIHNIVKVVIVQSYVRGFLAKKDRMKRTQAVITIQMLARRWCSIRTLNRLRQEYGELMRSIDAATVIQTWSRRYVAIKQYYHKRNDYFAAVTIQKYYRCHLKTIEYHIALYYIVQTQSLFRGFVERNRMNLMKESSTKIQAVWRGYVAKLYFDCDCLDIVVAQATVRRWIARREYEKRKYDRRERSVILLQSYFRQWLEDKRLGLLHTSAATIQKYYRCHLKTIEYNIALYSIVQTQSLYRGFVERKRLNLMIESSTKIQAMWRGYVMKLYYNFEYLDIVIVQATVRRWIARREYFKRKEDQKKNSVIVLQSYFRQWLDCKRIRSWHKSAVTIQKCTRGFLSRADLEIKNFAACEIQKIWRGYRLNLEYMVKLLAVIKIQSILRRVAACNTRNRLQRSLLERTAEFHMIHKAASKIQEAYRNFIWKKILSRYICSVQSMVRVYLARRKLAVMKNGFCRLQSVYRGNKLRKKRSKRLRDTAFKVAEANKKARSEPHMVLGKRTSSALSILLTSQRLAELTGAMVTLETSTRLSVKCCHAFSNVNAPKVLYKLIRTCNRSLPHVALLKLILKTLSNVVLHESLIGSVATTNSIEILLDVIQMFRDKVPLFYLSLCLIKKIVSRDELLLKQLCKKENRRRLEGLYSISTRKLASAKKTPLINKTARGKKIVESGGDLKSCVITMKKLLHATNLARQQIINKKKSMGETILDF